MTHKRPELPERTVDSLQLSIANKVVLRAEGRLAIIVAAVTVVLLAGIWILSAAPPPAGVVTSNSSSLSRWTMNRITIRNPVTYGHVRNCC